MEEKILKRWLKRKLKITEALLIGFLITGGIVYGQDLEAVNDKDISVEFTFTTKPTYEQETEMAVAWPALPSSLTDFINNGIIKNSYTETNIANNDTEENNERKNKGNGLILGGNNQNIINAGSIKGAFYLNVANSGSADVNSYVIGSGNGIVAYSEENGGIGTIANSGSIRGEVDLSVASSGSVRCYGVGQQSGNGIVAYSWDNSSNIGALENSGSIRGKFHINADITSGSSDDSFAYGRGFGSGNGIVAYSEDNSSNIGAIVNSGSIRGEVDLRSNTPHTYIQTILNGNGIGVYIYGLSGGSSNIGAITNTGSIKGKSHLSVDTKASADTYISGNGIVAHGWDKSSSIGAIVNSGSIRGESNLRGEVPTSLYVNGNGIVANAEQNTSIGNITNSGSISGEFYLTDNSISSPYANGNGIVAYNGINSSNIGALTNNGTISGYASVTPRTFENELVPSELEFSGNGMALRGNITESIINSGIIKGSKSALVSTGIGENSSITNYGLMAGREIYGQREELSTDVINDINLDNSGFTDKTNQEKNLGIYVNLKDILSQEGVTGGDFVGRIDGDDRYAFVDSVNTGSSGTDTKVTIISPDGNQTPMTIINTNTEGRIVTSTETITSQNNKSVDTYLDVTNLKAGETPFRENLIINGVGQAKGTLVIGEDTVLTNSIINGYNTALYVEDGKTFTGDNIIFNGGGLKSDVAIIRGGTDEGLLGINVILTGMSVTNGLVDMGAGEHDILSLANTTQVNGDLDGGAGDTDILNLGDGGSGKLIILHDIRNFENIVSKGSTTLFETTEVTGLKNLEIMDGDLVLRIDPTITKVVEDHEEVIGHALYSNEENLTIKSTGGNLRVGLNGAGKGTIIHLGSGNVMEEKIDSIYDEDDRLRTTNAILDAIIYDPGTNEKIIIDSVKYLPKPEPPAPPEPEPPTPVEPDTPDTPVVPPASDIVVPSEPHNYDIMNDIYLSALSVDEEEKLSGDIDDYNQGVYEIYSILDQIYANNPYGYSLRAARDSMVLFEDALSYFTIKPNLHEWIVQGKALYSHVEDKNEGTKKYKIRSNSAGGLASAEYGLTQETSIGVVAGGLHGQADFRNSTKYKGDSFYAGLYMKHDYNRFRFWTGAGYLYTSAKAERNIGNIFHSYSTKDTYDVNSMDLFGEVRYMPEPVNGWSLEPRAKLSFYYSSQDGADEGYDKEKFSVGTKKESQSTGRLELAGDIRKDLALTGAEMRNRLSLGTGILLGKHRKDVTGYVIGAEGNGTDFTIRGTEIPKVTGKVGYSLEYERSNGIIGTLSASYEFGGDYKNFETVVGLGYRF